jgi:uncharacterized repeat protein (TIGR01451 family)/CSLREA domain-containing protein
VRRISLFVAATVAMLASLIAVAPPAHADGFTVNSTSDAKDANPGDKKCATSTGSCTLRAAVMEANTKSSTAHTTITLPSGTYTLTISGSGEDAAATGDLDLKNDLNIIAKTGTATIQAGSGFGDRIFDIPSGLSPAPPIELHELIITKGVAPAGENGGGIRDLGAASLQLTNMTFSNNSAGGSGGGIYVATAAGNTFTTNVVSATGNSAGGNGGAIDIEGATTAALQRITASGNNAANGGGLSAYVAAGATGVGTFGFTNTFDNNTATSIGGGLYLGRTSGINLTVSNNHANFGGGIGLVAAGKPSSISGRNDIFGNTATTAGGGLYTSACGTSCGLVYNTNIHDNAAPDGAGAYINDGLTLTNMSVFLNTATGSTYGGGLYHAGSQKLTMTNVTVDSNTNTKGSSLGSAVIIASTATDTMTDLTIAKNSGATANGIAVLTSATAATVKNTIVTSSGRNCTGSITSLGYNIDTGDTCNFHASGDMKNQDARLAPFTAHDNGGFTATVLPNPLSVAIDAGTNTGCPLTDARVVQRPFGGKCDIGAVEFSSLEGNSNIQTLNLTGSPNPVAKGAQETYTLTVLNSGPQPSHRTVLTDQLPASVTYKSCSATGSGVCAHVGNRVTVTWDSLAIDQSTTVTIVATVNSDTTATQIVNSPHAYSDNPDNYPTSNSASCTVQIS